MPRISRLPADLANKIAAGEVVERPASVVKELVENALDAKASRVRVEIDLGGMARIHVTDDGVGMDREDLVLAVARHATSKIATADDLSRIETYGFRGEALPSIASVARVVITSRVRGTAEGTEIAVDDRGSSRTRPAGAGIGTSVEVKDLFWNVPARLKFLKSTGTESAHVGEVVLVSALARPDVTFTLVRDGKVAREHLRAASRLERVSSVLAEARLERCVGARGHVRVEAFLAPPERARAGAGALHLFVNGRAVKDRHLARSVANAYGSVLEPGRYPVGAVYLDVPLDRVDVNVHPQKAEVRFADGRGVFEAVTRELHGCLAKAFSLPDGNPWHRRPPPSDGSVGPLAHLESAFPLNERPSAAPWWRPPEPGAIAPQAADPLRPASNGDSSNQDLFAGNALYARLRFLGQVGATFLVCEGSDGLYILDQHAAAERVTFARLRDAFRSRNVATQRLLIPDVIAVSPAEHALVEERAGEALLLGLELRPLSGHTVAVHSVPLLLARASPERLVRDLIAELARESKRPFQDAADLVLATMACHGSIRAGDAVTREEVEALLAALDAVDFSGHCPHGRPVVMRLSFDELERRVGR